jgi:hypothetical protein
VIALVAWAVIILEKYDPFLAGDFREPILSLELTAFSISDGY